MPSGIVIINKPADWTSQDVTAKLRGIFSERRVGHGGTLDPMATGVLPVFIGRATRAVQFFESADKEYLCSLRLGVTTSTQDITGEILRRCPADVTEETLSVMLKRFCGAQQQIPPMYSAIKIKGKRLYEMARKGQEIERAPRSIIIHELEHLGRDEVGDIKLRIVCSKGTYIRTLCADIGSALGCGGCMSRLQRTRAGSYTLSQAVSVQALQQAKNEGCLQQFLLSTDSLFSDYPAITLSASEERICRNGNPLFQKECLEGYCRVYGPDGDFLMLGNCRDGRLTTVKSFFEVT